MTEKEGAVLAILQDNPFISQQELADQLGLPRSTVASLLSKMMEKGYLLGRAYVLNPGADVICIGGMNVDRKYRLEGALLPQTSNPVQSSQSLGGVARNIAENLGRLDQSVSLLSLAGQDHDYDWLKAQTEPYVNLSQVTQLEGQSTSSYTAILDQEGQMQLGLADMGICDLMTPAWLAGFKHQLARAKFLVADLNLPQDTVASLLALAQKLAVPLLVVPVSGPKMARLPTDLTGLDWLVVNQDESEVYFGCRVASEEDFLGLAAKWLSRGLTQVLITRGKQASLYAHKDGTRRLIQPPAVDQVVDVTGAGDSFASGLIYGLLQGKPALEAIPYGLTNAYHTIQSEWSVRPDLSAQLLEQNHQELKEKGAI